MWYLTIHEYHKFQYPDLRFLEDFKIPTHLKSSRFCAWLSFALNQIRSVLQTLYFQIKRFLSFSWNSSFKQTGLLSISFNRSSTNNPGTVRRFDDLTLWNAFKRFDASMTFWRFDAFWRSDALMLQYASVLFNELLSKCQLVITYARGQKAWYGPIPLTYPNISCIGEISANKKVMTGNNGRVSFFSPQNLDFAGKP